MTSLFLLAGSGTAADFRAAFTATDDATDLLIPALTNPNAAERAKIAMFLLDQGADVNGDSEGRSPMHVLFAQQKHSFKQEAPLVERMLEAGADINQRERRGDLPILHWSATPPCVTTWLRFFTRCCSTGPASTSACP